MVSGSWDTIHRTLTTHSNNNIFTCFNTYKYFISLFVADLFVFQVHSMFSCSRRGSSWSFSRGWCESSFLWFRCFTSQCSDVPAGCRWRDPGERHHQVWQSGLSLRYIRPSVHLYWWVRKELNHFVFLKRVLEIQNHEEPLPHYNYRYSNLFTDLLLNAAG